MPRKKLIFISSIIGGIGAVFLILGLTTSSGLMTGLGNLMLFFAIMMWVYKYFLLKRMDKFQSTSLVGLERKYKQFLQYALTGKNPRWFFLGTFGILILSFIAVGIAKPNVLFFPENQPNQIMVYIEYPEGTDIEKTNDFTKIIEKKVYAIANKYVKDGKNFMVETAIAQVGNGAGNPQTDGGSENDMPHRGKVTLTMREFKYRLGINSLDVMEEIRKAVQGYPGVSIIVEKEQNGPPAGYPVNIEITGEDYGKLLTEA